MGIKEIRGLKEIKEFGEVKEFREFKEIKEGFFASALNSLNSLNSLISLFLDSHAKLRFAQNDGLAATLTNRPPRSVTQRRAKPDARA